MNDYKELIAHIQGDAAFRHIISECGADGRVWFDKRFICDYVSHLKYAIEQLVNDYEILAKMYAKVNEDLCVRTKERDAAVEDLKEGSFCMNCKHLVSTKEEKPCRHCSSLTGGGEDNWEWRGVQEDNDGKID